MDWEATPADQLPDRRPVLQHIDKVEKAVADWLDGLCDEGLLSAETGYPWTGTRQLGRALYLLRHTQNHIGEVNSEPRRRGLRRGKW
jgi:hypothetical protein